MPTTTTASPAAAVGGPDGRRGRPTGTPTCTTTRQRLRHDLPLPILHVVLQIILRVP